MISRRLLIHTAASLLGCVAGQALSAPNSAAPVSDALTPPRNAWVMTQGGSGGKIVKVTNLDAAGPGSLKEALEQTYPRIVVFEVGGVIDMAGGSIKVRSPFVTIAGQTAPAPGITVIRGKFSISTHDVVLQHMAFRPGRAGNAPRSGWEADGLTLYGAHDVIIDHCSLSWATDENLSVSGTRFDGPAGSGKAAGAPYNIVVSNSIIAEALMNATHRKGGHSKGLLVHDNASNVLIIRNIFVSNHDRNALFKGGAKGAFVNNVVLNPGVTALSYNLSLREWLGQPAQTGRLSVIGNVYGPGANTRSKLPFLRILGEGAVEVHARDNVRVVSRGGLEPLSDGAVEASILRHDLKSAHVPADIDIWQAAQTWARLFETAGMRPWERDAVDAGILSRARGGVTRIIDSEQDVGGYPAYKPSRRAFNVSEWRLPDMRPRSGGPVT